MTIYSPNSSFSGLTSNQTTFSGNDWWVQNTGKTSSATLLDANTVRFQVQSGDQWKYDPNDRERSEVADKHLYTADQTIHVDYGVTVQPGLKNSADWLVFGQFHQNDYVGSPGYSPPVAIQLVGEKMRLSIGYETAPGVVTYRTLWTDAQDIVRGHTYKVSMDVKFDPNGSGHLHVSVDGVDIANYAGRLGYYSQTSAYWKEGIYREPSAETLTIDFDNLHIGVTDKLLQSLPQKAFTFDAHLLNDLGRSSSDGISKDGRISVSGTAAAHAEIKIFDNGALIAKTVADLNGLWSYQTQLYAGTHILTGTANSSLDLQSASDDQAIRVDTSTPGATMIAGLINDSGANRYDMITNDKHLAMHGYAEVGSLVDVFLGTTRIGSTITDASGHWTFSSATDLSDGSYWLNTRCTDLGGNTGISTGKSVVIDTITRPAEVRAITQTAAGTTFQGLAESGSTVTVKDGSVQIASLTTASNGTWSFTATNWSPGNHLLSITSVDAAGNTAMMVNPLLVGSTGNETLTQSSGANWFFGGAGRDIFVFQAGLANGNKVLDFYHGADKIAFSGYDVANVHIDAIAANKWLISDGVHADTFTINFLSTLSTTDFIFV